MWQYAWYASGSTDVDPRNTEHPVKFFFDCRNKACYHAGCFNDAFGKCGWCTRTVCFEHGIKDVHYCEIFIP